MNEAEFYRLDLGITKCYLIKCLGGFLLVDTGYHSDYEKFLKRMREVHIDISQIKYILLTHHHDDHAGFVTKLVNQIGAKLIVHKNGVAPLQRGESQDTMKPVNLRIKLILSLFAIFHKNFRYPPVVLKNDDIVITGDNYELLSDLGIDGMILCTPGHCKDSISVILKDGISVVGDVAMNFLKLSGIKYRPIYVENIQDVFESWQKIIEHGAKTIYPAHGSPFPAERLTIMRKRFSTAKW